MILSFKIYQQILLGSNLVRPIFNKFKEVLYLTRSDTPYQFVSKTNKIFKHLSVISFKPSALEVR